MEQVLHAALLTFSDMPELKQLAKTIRLVSDLGKLSLESIESKFVISSRHAILWTEMPLVSVQQMDTRLVFHCG